MTQTSPPIVVPPQRVFLFLQGPNGPFFAQLGRMLERAGARCLRVGFNAADEALWPRGDTYVPYAGYEKDWPGTLRTLMDKHAVTDVVLFDARRAAHGVAIEEARAAGLPVHVFDEGGLDSARVTYNRAASRGAARLAGTTVAQMREALAQARPAVGPVAGSGPDDTVMRTLHGAAYAARVVFANRRYAGPGRNWASEAATQFIARSRRLSRQPAAALARRRTLRRLRAGGFPYHVVLMQADTPAAAARSPFPDRRDFLQVVADGFAQGAGPHHHLVVADPVRPVADDPLADAVRRLALDHRLQGRIHLIRGGRPDALLDQAHSAVTVDARTGLSALERGLPLRVFGPAIYARPEFTSRQPLPEFFARPEAPCMAAYADFRAYLLRTRQVNGGFHTAAGRQALLRQVVDMMLSPEDPYEVLLRQGADPAPALRVVP